ncbi:MAG: hypothetical protein FWD68_00580 [Alphaproteobacteria bacterium]|nr:hypothetical protein [Alphaproteobacteria bacterium]
MTDTEVPARTGLRTSTVFRRAWDVFLANFPLYFAIGLLVALPWTLLELSFDAAEIARTWNFTADFLGAAALACFAQFVSGTLGYAVTILTAFSHLCGERRSIGETLVRAARGFLPLAGVAVLITLGVLVGTILLVVPGIMLAVRWAVACPACIVEGAGPIASLRRSAALTDGERWVLFELFLLFLVGGAIAGGLGTFLLGLAGGRPGAVIGSLLVQGIVGGYGYCLSWPIMN